MTYWIPLVVLWLVSAARVTAALARGEVFATEATVACAYLVALPLCGAHSWFKKKDESRNASRRGHGT